jgi:hypothetical protein
MARPTVIKANPIVLDFVIVSSRSTPFRRVFIVAAGSLLLANSTFFSGS